MIREITLFVLCILIFSSCEKKGSYQNAHTIPGTGWAQGQIIYFSDSLTSKDPENLHFEIELRHTNLYSYQNIWLSIQTKCSDGTMRTDSIDWKLSEPNGRWLGTGWGSLYNVKYRLPDLKIPRHNQKRWFSIEIQHGLNDKILKNVESVGVRLY